MIIGTGIDIVEIARLQRSIERYKEHFLERTYTGAELEQAGTRGARTILFYAGRWAAKEAIAKALGTGFGASCGWLDISVLDDSMGKPVAAISGAAAETMRKKGVREIHVSISHDGGFAVAMAIAEG